MATTKLSGEQLHLKKLYRDREELNAKLRHKQANNQNLYQGWLYRAINKLTEEISTLEKRVSVTARR